MNSLRIEKINEHIREEIGKLFLSELRLKSGVFVTIAKIRTTPDLKNVRVFISVFPEQDTDYVMKSLEHELYKLQGLFNKRLRTRPLPRLIFEKDETEKNAQMVEETLLVIKKEQE